MKNLIILSILMLCVPFAVKGQQTRISGYVISADDNEPLAGASVVVEGTTKGAITDAEGKFSFEISLPVKLTVSFIGFRTTEINVESPGELMIILQADATVLDEISVVSTGYQKLPKERVTGSFEQVDEELIDRSVSTDILSRLKNITSGVLYEPTGQTYDINIRGVSTLFANKKPLIILDNFPYDGDINTINPNDVENITILKDAAAASIWGARAGNGVIVITTKSGRATEKAQLSFNSNITSFEQADAFYLPRMGVTDYLDIEKALFQNGYYNSDETSRRNPAISPAVELMILNRDGLLSDAELETALDQLRNHDVREDFNKYLYRPALNQQYSVSLRGGSQVQQYYISAGVDKNDESLVGDEFQRVTLNSKNSWNFFDNKIEADADLFFVQTKDINNGIAPADIRMSSSYNVPFYTRLVDDEGNPVAITKDFRNSFKSNAEDAGLFDWSYNPLEELNYNDNSLTGNDIRIAGGLKYNILSGLSLSAFYQFWNNNSSLREHYPAESYYARNFVNSYAQDDGTGKITFPVPAGGILDLRSTSSSSHTYRSQLNFERKWNTVHHVNFVGGYEVKDHQFKGQRQRFYGYEESTATSTPVDYTTRYRQYHNSFSRITIPNRDLHYDRTDRFISYYGNLSYVFDNRYIMTMSGRKDQSNLFGVETNQRGVPLWSVGLGWNINEEFFFNIPWVNYLKVRGTYGYNGNIDKSVTAFTTARYSGTSSNTGLPYASILNPPNPQLRWERVQIFNLGLDFVTLDSRISGSFEYYTKNGSDLIGYAPVSATTGQEMYRGNVASTRGSGIDLHINSVNLQGKFGWETSFLFSHSQMEVTDYKDEPAVYEVLQFAERGSFPQEGYPLYAMYSYKWAGLDPDTGDPQGYLNGEPSSNVGEIIDIATPDSLIFHGSSRPEYFGGFRNTLSWGNLSFSFNISFRMDYFVRRRSIYYGSTMGLGGHSDYSLRWQEPGDETLTDVPSVPESRNYDRDNFYSYSSILVEKGDNIRLQDINLSYSIKAKEKLPFNDLNIFIYINNPGLIWKATDNMKDPDYQDVQLLRSYSLGLRANF